MTKELMNSKLEYNENAPNFCTGKSGWSTIQLLPKLNASNHSKIRKMIVKFHSGGNIMFGVAAK